MDKIYTSQDVANVIANVEELAIVNADLEQLLHHGSNDERLVAKKRELETSIRKYKPLISDFNEPLEDEDGLAYLKVAYDVVLSRYKERKRQLETIIKGYANGNSD
jgi:hypothetical protein